MVSLIMILTLQAKLYLMAGQKSESSWNRGKLHRRVERQHLIVQLKRKEMDWFIIFWLPLIFIIYLVMKRSSKSKYRNYADIYESQGIQFVFSLKKQERLTNRVRCLHKKQDVRFDVTTYQSEEQFLLFIIWKFVDCSIS